MLILTSKIIDKLPVYGLSILIAKNIPLELKMAEHHHISNGWYEDGQIFERGVVCQNGIRHGEHKSWYPDGHLYQFDFYRNDELEGKCRSYHSNGLIWAMEFYQDGKRKGEYKWWHEDGKLERHQFFHDGYGVSELTSNRKCAILKIRKFLAKKRISIIASMLIPDLAKIPFTINRV